jgi:uncharacterized glyoxalase superfamily protein PhnB
MSDKGFHPGLHYRDPRAALEWLERAFGFEISMVVTRPDGSLGHCEMLFQDATISIGREWADWAQAPSSLDGRTTCMIAATVPDVDALFARAVEAGARVLAPPEDKFYGERSCLLADPEGHVWSFSQVLRRMTYEDMEAASGGAKVRARL